MNARQVVLLAWVSIPLCAQSDLPREVLLLSRIRHRAAEALAHIPDFTCLETIERATRTSDARPFHPTDVLLVEVAHVGQHELYAWPGAASFEHRTLVQMVGAGMISSGEFVSHALSVFAGNVAVIRYSGEDTFGGHPAVRYDYDISPLFSGYSISSNGRTAITGVRGVFWADSETYDLLWLSAVGTGIPPDLGILRTLTEIEYSRVRIASRDVLLPQAAKTEMLAANGTESRNRIEFTHCRQYTTESVLSFTQDPAALAQSDEHANNNSEFILPPNLVCRLRLVSGIVLARARIGDAVKAEVAADIAEKKHVVAPKGTVVSGRVRVIQKDTDGYMVGLEFTDLDLPGAHARFLASLVSVDSRYGQIRRRIEKKIGANTIETSIIAQMPPQLAGVGIFFTAPGVTALPDGMEVEWKTIALGK